MPLFHIGGSGWALMGMSRGGTSVILRDMDPTELVRLVEAEKVTKTFVVPAVLMALLACPATTTRRLDEPRHHLLRRVAHRRRRLDPMHQDAADVASPRCTA